MRWDTNNRQTGTPPGDGPAAARGQKSRQHRPLVALRRYDAAISDHRSRVPSGTHSGDGLMDHAQDKPRRWARHLDENLDLITGMLTALSLRATSVEVEFAALTTGDELAEDLNARLAELWTAQGEFLDVSHQYTLPELRQLLGRTWLRDGEVFAVHLEAAAGIEYGGPVPYGIQSLEPDYLPFAVDDGPNITHGIELSPIRRPVAYHFRSSHPGMGPGAQLLGRATTVAARNVSHLRRVDRLSQLRGITCLHSIIRRISDLMDMEESERLAARFASAACAAITRSPDFQAGTVDSGMNERSLFIEGGMIFDDLLPGEKVELINPTRPNPNAPMWRDLQVRAAAAGADASASTTLRDYSGTYSSQRQELVEHQYLVSERLQAPFTGRLWGQVARRFAQAAVRHGIVRPAELRNVDLATVGQVELNYRGIPWIDMLKEVQAEKLAVDAGFKSRPQVIRERGGNRRRVDRERARDEAPGLAAPAPGADEDEDDNQQGTGTDG